MLPVNAASDLIDVALFPIPNVVAFPGVDLPLHVFEPRYRQLVNDCISDNRMIGVCHTIKAIHQPSSQKVARPANEQTLKDMLSSNQTTYKPHAVFSAGHCELLETLPDGRMLANVSISVRLELLEELQSLPYRIVRCRALIDLEGTEAGPDQQLNDHPGVDNIEAGLQRNIHQRLIALVEPENAELAVHLAEPSWLMLRPADYSFRIFQCLRFDADVMQHILATRSARERLQTLWQLLRNSSDEP